MDMSIPVVSLLIQNPKKRLKCGQKPKDDKLPAYVSRDETISLKVSPLFRMVKGRIRS